MSNHDPLLQACTEDLNDSRITVKRDGRRATFENEDRASIKCVDLDCWIASAEAPKADYILAKPGVADVIVELKGKDIVHAAKQIVATLARWKSAQPISTRSVDSLSSRAVR